MDLEELLAVQAGVVTFAQARAAGVSVRQLRHGTSLVRLRQGVYADAARVSVAGPAERAALEVAAVRVTTRVDHVAVGATAVVLHGLPLLGPLPPRPQLAERKELRLKHHGVSATLPQDQVVVAHGVPVVSLARAACDVARRRGYLAGVVVADAVLARAVTAEELAAAVRACRGWPGGRHAQQAAAFADGRSESALESIGRVRFDEVGLPSPDLQVRLGDDQGVIGRVDHYWPEHRTVGEADGALKYADRSDLLVEKRREDRLRDAGFEVVRYSWDDALLHPQVLAARVRRAFDRAARAAV